MLIQKTIRPGMIKQQILSMPMMKELQNSRKNLVILNSKKLCPKVLCLSGWGQKFDSLQSIFDPIFFAQSFDYSRLNSVESFFSVSEKKILQPKLLVLLATPFQMVKDSRVQASMATASFNEFYKSFSQAPKQA